MAFTRHGHHIPGTFKLRKRLFQTKNCGGVVACQECVEDVSTLVDSSTNGE